MAVLKSFDVGAVQLSALLWGDGPKRAVILHGFPDTADGMTPVATRLARAGYTVCAPYLRGYHPSGLAPDGRYDIAAVSADILTLLDRLDFRDTLLVGHDWGAVIAYACAAQDVQRIDRAVLLSVPPIPTFTAALLKHPAQLYRSRYMTYFQMGALSEYLVARNDYAYIESLWRRWSPDLAPPEEHLARVKASFSEPGYLKAALSYYRALIPVVSAHWSENWRLVNEAPRCPVSVAVGRNDGCIAPEMFANSPYPTTVIENAGHFLMLEQPDDIMALCLKP